MPKLEGEDYGTTVEFGITEWWNGNGDHFDGAPTPDQLIGEARQVTVYIVDGKGNELYFTDFSPIGWLDSEIQADVDDAYNHYVISGGTRV